MNHTNVVRRGSMALIVGAAGSVIAGLVVQAGVQPMTTVSDDMWSYPWTSDALVPVSILWAALHVLIFVGLLGVAQSGLAGDTLGARAGALLALAGTAVLFVAELASIPIRDAQMDDASAVMVGALFGIGTALSGVGFVTFGVAVLRNGRWPGAGRYTPLIAGIVTLGILGLAAISAIAAGVALYGLCLLAVGVSVHALSSPPVLREQIA